MNLLALRRRLFYIIAMVALLVPLYMLGTPSVRKQNGEVSNQGGTLAQLRTKYDLGQGDLGEIDPASESMRLATLGLRGVAATILWQRAEEYKKRQYWDRLSATLNQIAVLQPHFVKVWEFQSHNLSYNISVEFDDYRQRYEWVKRGIEYLIKGSKYNKRKTEMPYELGWFFGNKMGVADEKLQFRDLYRNDNNFHNEVNRTSLNVTDQDGLGPDKKPDNWLSGRLYYQHAYEMVKQGATPARSPLMFYRMGSSWLTKYAEALQAEGQLGDPSFVAWRRAAEALNEFGNMQIQTTFGDEISLNGIQKANEDYARALQEFKEYCGETYDRLVAKQREQLTQEQEDALAIDEFERNFEQLFAAEQANSILSLPPKFVAAELPAEKQIQGFQLAEKVERAKSFISHVEIYRNQINYNYWRIRCEAEQEPSAVAARANMFEANKLLDKGDLDEAIKKYDLAWQSWDELYNQFPSMMLDDSADEVIEAIERYRKLLEEPNLPKDFPLSNFLRFREINKDNLLDPTLMSMVSEWPTRYPDRNFLNEMLRKTGASKDSSTTPDSTPAPEPEPAQPDQPAEPVSLPEKPANPEVAPPDEGAPPVPSKPAEQAAPAAEVAADSGDALKSAGDDTTVAAPDEGVPPSPTKDE
jgi:hypothetical protein